MYRQIIVSNEKDHTIELPESFFGKTVEITMVEVTGPEKKRHALPSIGKVVSFEKLFETFSAAPDFPGLDSIRDKAWPPKW